METPAFLESEQHQQDPSMYKIGHAHTMSQRRPHHLPILHHPHVSRTMPTHMAHVHNGRVVGVTGVPGGMISNKVQVGGGSATSPTSAHYPDSSLSHMSPATLPHQAHVGHGEPLYSHQAPRGHEHVYQSPRPRVNHRHHRDLRDKRNHRHRHHRDMDHIDHMGTRDHINKINHMDTRGHMDTRDHIDQKNHMKTRDHIDHRDHMDTRDNMDTIDHMDQRNNMETKDHMDQRNHMDTRYHMDHRNFMDSREHMDPCMNQRMNPDIKANGIVNPCDELDISNVEHRSDNNYFHYSGSDYSSSEPIYAQPHLYPRTTTHGTSIHTVAYTNTHGSQRTVSHITSGTPAKYLVPTDSCGNSTASSTLPTVSALLAPEAAHAPPTPTHTSTPTHHSSMHHGKGGNTPTPVKLKRQGMFGAWKVRFMRGEVGRRRACLMATAIAVVLLLLLGGLATALYFTLGGELSAIIGETPKLIQLTETGSGVVEADFKITNLNYWNDLQDTNSEEFLVMARAIENELDSLYGTSVWSREYNHSKVISFAKGSLLVQARLVVNSADVAAAQKLGTAFLRGLRSRHGHKWLGQYSIDITSIRFTEITFDTQPLMSTTFPPTISPTTPKSPAAETSTTTTIEATKPIVRHNVGWGQWSPWSKCSLCSPQYDQIRTRKCRMDDGVGVILNTIEPCLSFGLSGEQLDTTVVDMETRPCHCHHTSHTITTTTTSTTTKTTPSWKEKQPPQEEREDEFSTGVGDAFPVPGSVMGTRVGQAMRNRTAIGLSKLSHRERELLS